MRNIANIKYNKLTATKASLRLGNNPTLVSGRIWKGWSKEKAFITPVGSYFTNIISK